MAKRKSSKASAKVPSHKVVSTWTEGNTAFMSVRVEDDHIALHGEPVGVEYIGSTSILDEEGKSKSNSRLLEDLVKACKDARQYHKQATTFTPPQQLPLRNTSIPTHVDLD